MIFQSGSHFWSEKLKHCNECGSHSKSVRVVRFIKVRGGGGERHRLRGGVATPSCPLTLQLPILWAMHQQSPMISERDVITYTNEITLPTMY